MSLEVGKGEHRIIVEDIFSHGHLVKPFSILYRQENRAVLVHYVHGAERPAVYFERFSVLFRCIAVSLVICVCFHNMSIGKLIFYKRFHPRSRYNVWAVRLSGVELYRHPASQLSADTGKYSAKPIRGQVSGEIYF